MTWYAVRTLPGAQVPKREYWAIKEHEDGKPIGGKKGYRVVSGVASDYSAVELALKDAGFTYYMPVEFSVVRNRHKKGLYELRRFALLKGYVFVSELEDGDWPRLGSTAGIRDVVMNNGKPYPISTMDIHRLRMYEQSSRANAVAEAKAKSISEDRQIRNDRKNASKQARKKLFPGREVKVLWGDKVGRDATVQAWQDQDMVRVLISQLDALQETVTVPYEFLKAS